MVVVIIDIPSKYLEKTTFTDTTMNANPTHTWFHKLSVYLMSHKLVRIPLEKKAHKAEKEKIKTTTVNYGYEANNI